MLDVEALSPAMQADLRRVRLWRAVRPATLMCAPLLEAHGWLTASPTVLGPALHLSLAARAALKLPRRIETDMVMSSAVYLQDAQAVLETAGYRHLVPGRRPYFNVQHGSGSCPVLGRLTLHGYSQATIERHLILLEPDLLSRGRHLVVVHPQPERLTLSSRLLKIMFVQPAWG